MIPAIKICGLTTSENVRWAVEAGADMIGFVSFPPSPRHLDVEAMAVLAESARGSAEIVLLAVEPADADLAAIVSAVRPEWIQLHGKETPERVEAIARRFELPIMKAFGVAEPDDLAAVAPYAEVVDRFLFDAKAPRNADRPGGLGRRFDWALLAALDLAKPFMLSGGLDPDNVGEAVSMVRPFGVDVSSGVEDAPGVKSRTRIEAFVAAVRKAALDDIARSTGAA